MLSIFPEILFLSPFAAFLIRVALGLLFAFAAWELAKKPDLPRRIGALVKLIIGVALIAGAWTQVAALAAALLLIGAVAMPKMRVSSLSTILLALVMAVSLILTGAGALAFDLPL